MGYRLYLGVGDKSMLDETTYFPKNFNDDTDSCWNITNGARERLQELYQFNIAYQKGGEQFTELLIPLGCKKFKEFYEGDFHQVTKEALLELIKVTRNVIKEDLYNKVKGVSERDIFGITLKSDIKEPKEHLELLIRYFDNKLMSIDTEHEFYTEYADAYDIKEDSMCITHGNSYEYAIFNLIYLYKTFDWENKVLVYYGW